MAKRPYELRPSVRRQQRDRAWRLVDAVSRRTGVPAATFLAKSRHPLFFQLRVACAWLIRRVDGLSYHEIALVLGQNEHSAAAYLVRRGDNLRADDWTIRLLTDSIMEKDA